MQNPCVFVFLIRVPKINKFDIQVLMDEQMKKL